LGVFVDFAYPGHSRVDGVDYKWADVNEGWGRRLLADVLVEAERVLGNGGVVVVHCVAGKHRTGAFCALLMVFPLVDRCQVSLLIFHYFWSTNGLGNTCQRVKV